MAITRPYRRCCRQHTDGSYANGGRAQYIEHPRYAKSPEHYVRAFLLLQKDLQEFFDYVEPADSNQGCHSYRIHELLLRACVEVEANCKAILRENDFPDRRDLNMTDYWKLNPTHRLSSYAVKIPTWHGEQGVRAPFKAWENAERLPWYQAYNATKHDRHEAFAQATFGHMLDAVCGVLVLLSSQFHTNDFTSGNSFLCLEGPRDGMEAGIGDYFRVRFPEDWPEAERYDFDWQAMKEEADPFRALVF